MNDDEVLGVVHHGHNLKRIRIAKGEKQDAVAKAIFGEKG